VLTYGNTEKDTQKQTKRYTKGPEDLGWPSYWTQYTKPVFDFAEDKRGSNVKVKER